MVSGMVSGISRKIVKFIRDLIVNIFLLVLIVGVVIGAFLLYNKLDSEGFFMSKEEKYFYKQFIEFKESGKKSIPLKELTNFEWDRVLFTGPYGLDTMESVLEKEKVNFKYKNKNDLYTSSSLAEQNYHIVFFDTNKSNINIYIITIYKNLEYRTLKTEANSRWGREENLPISSASSQSVLKIENKHLILTKQR